MVGLLTRGPKLSFYINSSLLLYWWKSSSVLRMAATLRTKALVPCSLHPQQAAEWPVGIVALDVSVYWIHSPVEKEWPSERGPSPPLLRCGLPWMWTHCSRSHLFTCCLPSDQLPPPGTDGCSAASRCGTCFVNIMSPSSICRDRYVLLCVPLILVHFSFLWATIS